MELIGIYGIYWKFMESKSQSHLVNSFACYMHAKSPQSCLTLCDSMDCGPPGSSVHGIFSRQEYWSGLPCPPPGDLPDPGIEPWSLASPALAGGFFTPSATWEAPVVQYVILYLKLKNTKEY